MGAMRMDVVPKSYLVVISSLAATWLLTCFIIGVAGPQKYSETNYLAYNCERNVHRYDPNKCSGVRLRLNETWEQTLPEVNLLNHYWLLQVFPFSYPVEMDNFTVDVDYMLKMSVILYGKHSESGEWYELLINDEHKDEMICFAGEQECYGFTLVKEVDLRYKIYKITISIADSPAKPYVGDMKFKYFTVNESYSKLCLGLRYTYFGINLILLVLWFWRMKSVPSYDWNYEQRTLSILLVSLILLNNPFYALELTKNGWFFAFLGSLFEVAFMCSLLLFWLFSIDKIRLDESYGLNWYQAVKVAAVGVYGILSLAFFSWVNAREQSDPVYDQSDNITGLDILFYFDSTVYSLITIWIVVISVMSVPAVYQRRLAVSRFFFVAFPTSICLFSIIVGIFTGTFGPYRRTALEFNYFFGLYNSYMWILWYGYWPASRDSYENVSEEEPTEASRIIPRNTTVTNRIDNEETSLSSSSATIRYSQVSRPDQISELNNENTVNNDDL